MGDRLAAVTGATGFLGLYIVRALSEAGWRVRVLARQAAAAARFADPAIEIVVGDLSDRRALAALVDGAEVVVHAAALIKAPSLAAFRAVNVEGAANLARALNACPPGRRLLIVSSMAARAPHLSHYAATKREGEAAIAETLRGRGHGWTAIRPCAVYGPADRETFAIFQAADRRVLPLPGPRAGRLALIHAADAAAAIARLCDAEPACSIFELADERVEGYRWPEIVAALEAALGKTILVLPLPAPLVRAAARANQVASRLAGRTAMFTPGKAREILHGDWGSAADRLPPPELWRPKIGLSEGFRGAVAWYRAQSWLPAATGRALTAGIAR